MTTLTTTSVKSKFYNPDGTPLVGAVVTALLSTSEVDNGMLVPVSKSSVTDVNGEATIDLWPNSRGSASSNYSLKVVVGSTVIWRGTIVVPEVGGVVDAHTLLQASTYPTLDAAQLAILQAQEYAAQASASAEAAAISAQEAALGGGGSGGTFDLAAVKDVAGGLVGLTLLKINFKNLANTFTSYFTNTNTASRTYTFPDKDITVAGLSDITGTNSGINTGDETTATIKTKLGITTISGDNTGDETSSTIKSKLGITTISGDNTGDESTASIKSKLGVTILSGSNTGDETSATIKSKLGVSVLSGSNTGDQTLTSLGIPNVENKSSADIRSEITSGNVTSALGFTPLSNSANTDAVTEGTTNLYFTATRVRSVVLTGLSTATNAVISATDTVLTAFGKLQKQITDHFTDSNNPHSVNKTQVGLSNVDNTSDASKPISTATQSALDNKASLAGNTFSGAQILSDQQLSRAMIIDCGYVFVDKGNSGTTSQTFDYTVGSHQKLTATGNHTNNFSNFPPTGNSGYMQVDYVNAGAFTITWGTTINWKLPNGTYTTSLATYLAANTGRTALQTSGTDSFVFWYSEGSLKGVLI